MGGSASVEFVDDGGVERAEWLARAVEAEACRIEAKYSRYREESVVSEINRNAGRTPVAVDEETEMLVRAALDMARMTEGRFDPTVGPLRRAWDFKMSRVPSADEIAALLPLVDAESVSVRDRTVFLRKPGMEIDLGGVGKEYAVDRAARLLEAEGIDSAIVNFAGDVRTIGSRGDGHPWKVGVADPLDRSRCRFAVRALGGAGIATSGRLRARLRQGWRAVPPHPGCADRLAGARHRVRDDHRRLDLPRRALCDRGIPSRRRKRAWRCSRTRWASRAR